MIWDPLMWHIKSFWCKPRNQIFIFHLDLFPLFYIKESSFLYTTFNLVIRWRLESYQSTGIRIMSYVSVWKVVDVSLVYPKQTKTIRSWSRWMVCSIVVLCICHYWLYYCLCEDLFCLSERTKSLTSRICLLNFFFVTSHALSPILCGGSAGPADPSNSGPSTAAQLMSHRSQCNKMYPRNVFQGILLGWLLLVVKIKHRKVVFIKLCPEVNI